MSEELKFGTSGLRGLVELMRDDVCAAWTTAFLAHLSTLGIENGEVLVGRDLRPSSSRIAAACVEAICAAGWSAVDCGAVPTPALALEAGLRGAPAIMVTGSHIPFDRNGLKFYRPDGEIDKEDEAGIRERFACGPSGNVSEGEVPRGSVRDCPEAGERYARRLTEMFGTDALSGWRVAVWQHSAVGRDLVIEALSSLGAETTPLARTDGFVPIDTEAVSARDAEQIALWVREGAFDALVSTDGDGDRPLVADETGRVLRGDLLGLLTSRALMADAVATPLSSNTALERSGWVGRTLRTRIGSPYVIEGMMALARAGARLPVGYEANGGLLLGGEAVGATGARLAPLATRDALLPICATLVDAARRGVRLSQLADQAPKRFTASDRLTNAPSDRSAALLNGLAADPELRASLVSRCGALAVLSVDLTDGVRMTLAGDEILHLRASGNAPELRVYAEAASAERAEAIVQAALVGATDLLSSALGEKS